MIMKSCDCFSLVDKKKVLVLKEKLMFTPGFLATRRDMVRLGDMVFDSEGTLSDDGR